MITKLVLSGGGPAGLAMLGAIRHLVETSSIDLAAVDSVHATSCGGIVGAALMMDHPWDTLHDYFVLRPWKDCNFHAAPILVAWNQGGMLTGEAIAEALSPLLTARGLDRNVCMGDFCAACGKELTVYATDIAGPKLTSIALSSKSVPNERLCDVLAASAAIPGVFAPVRMGEWELIDGCLLKNFPLDDCISQERCSANEVLGVRLDANITSSLVDSSGGPEQTNFVDMILKLASRAAATLSTHYSQNHEAGAKVVRCTVPINGARGFMLALSSQKERERLVEVGRASAAQSELGLEETP